LKKEMMNQPKGSRTMKEFVQKLIRAAKESRYKRWALVEEFKRRINEVIRRKLIEVEGPSRCIKQWYKHTTSLDRHWRRSRRKKEKLRSKKESRGHK